MTPVSGTCSPGFEPVRDAFVANFDERGEVGAAVHLIVDGETVVDLIGGWRDEARTRPWTPDTLVNVYSVGKAILATLVLELVDDGTIGLDTPIVDMWPEFGVGGKESATVRHALCHQAAVPAIREPLTDDDIWDWDTMAAAVAGTDAWWTPGDEHAYHTNTYGHLLGEIVRRVTGDLPHERLRRITDTIDADVWFGLPDTEHHRCADVTMSGIDALPASAPDTASDVERMVLLSMRNPPGYSSIGIVNTPQWRRAQVPSTNGHGTAAAVAGFYRALLDGEILSPELLADAARPHSVGPCPVLGEVATFGLGFTPTTPRRPFGPNPGSFGHFGTGGSFGFADPDAGVACGYVMNFVKPGWQSARNRALIDAVYAGLS